MVITMAEDKKVDLPGESEYGPDYVTLTNDEGYEETFELVDTLDYEDCTYVALLTASEDPEEYLNSDGNLIIMKVTEEDGERYLDDVTDDDEFDTVSEMFLARLADLYEFGDDEE